MRILLLAWKGSAAVSWAEELKAAGFTVFLEETTGERAWRTAKERGIQLVIIDGSRKPGHGKQTGHALRDTARTRHIPILWTNANSGDLEEIRSQVSPDALLDAPTTVEQVLEAVKTLSRSVHPHNGAAEESTSPRKPLRNSEKTRLPSGSSASPSGSGSIIPPDDYANIFSPPSSDSGKLFPGTIVVEPTPPVKKKVEAWKPAERKTGEGKK